MKIVKTIEYNESEYFFYLVMCVLVTISLCVLALKLFGKV
jgi:hypothetical protein